MKYEITHNDEFKSTEITFDGKPSETVRDALKAHGFRWHGQKKLWYGYKAAEEIEKAIRTAETRQIVTAHAHSKIDKIPVAGEAGELVIPEAHVVDEGTMYEGWEGGNNRKWRGEKELKSFLLEDFRAAGIKATIRFERAGYLTSITCTMTIREDEIVPFDEWKEQTGREATWRCYWLPYIDDDGHYQNIHVTAFDALPSEEREKLYPRILKCLYDEKVRRLTESGSTPDETVLAESARNRYDLLQRIVNSYNRDCSNSMIDYFDRAIYDHYTFKITPAA